jgi:uncharacterized protein (TIGR02996 family)
MSDEEALLAAIAAQPEEDTPRLAYADWLDEHGDHIRAEFIRVQIEIARVETLPRMVLNRHVDLFKRQQDLLDNHRDALLGQLAAFSKVAEIEFERGFVSELALGVDSLVNSRPSIASTNPLPRIIIQDVTERVRYILGFWLHPSAAEPFTEIISEIGTVPDRAIHERSQSRRGPGLVPFEFHPLSWSRLDKLDLSGCHFGDRSVASLLRTTSFPVLTDLDLSANYLTDAGVRALLASRLPSQLSRLILGGNPIEDQGAIELAEWWPTDENDHLQHLNFRFTNIGTLGQQALLARFGGRVDLF